MRKSSPYNLTAATANSSRTTGKTRSPKQLIKRPCIVIDTREQRPLDLGNKVHTCRGALATGDYALAFQEDAGAVERKALADFVQCAVPDWERFEAQLERLARIPNRALLIECPPGAMERGNYEGGLHPGSLVGRIASIAQDHGVHVVTLGSRWECSRFVESYLGRIWRHTGCRRYGFEELSQAYGSPSPAASGTGPSR